MVFFLTAILIILLIIPTDYSDYKNSTEKLITCNIHDWDRIWNIEKNEGYIECKKCKIRGS